MKKELSISTSVNSVTDSPHDILRLIADHGFTHIHWCHEWITEHFYSVKEQEDLLKFMDGLNLKMLAMHGTIGFGQWCNFKDVEDLRKQAVAQLTNRIEMTSLMGGNAIVMHLPGQSLSTEFGQRLWEETKKSIDELLPVAKKNNVAIALENTQPGTLDILDLAFSEYTSDDLNFCFDIGHSCCWGGGVELMEKYGDRLVAIHLHDNDGIDDLHNIPFTGKIDWEYFCKVLPTTSYKGPLNLEIHIDNLDELSNVYDAGIKLQEMIKK